MVALSIPGTVLAASLAEDPTAFLDLLADLAVLTQHNHLVVDMVAGCHDGSTHLVVPGFLRGLADALEAICPEE